MVRPAFLALLPLLTLAPALPAQAQWIAAGRWGDETGFRYVQPGRWMVLERGGRVEMSAEGDNHLGRLTLSCDAGNPRGRMIFDAYRGPGLAESVLSPEQPGRESVTLLIDGQPFSGTFEYRPNDRYWLADGGLTPEFLDALAGGLGMEMRDSSGESVTRFRLSGTGAARATVARLCGI